MTLIEQALAKIAEMEKRAEKATPGPWHHGAARNYDGYYVGPNTLPTLAACHTFNYPQDTEANACLIASARTDLPALCALVKALLSVAPSADLTDFEQAALKAFVEGK